MGTKGYLIYRYRGRYCCFFDSDPENLGKDIVSGMPNKPTFYIKWLLDTRNQVQETLDRVESRLSLSWEDIGRNLGADDTSERDDVWGNGLPDFLPDFFPMPCSIHIEWVHTIDLDHEVYSVNNSAHFPLNDIPFNWTDGLTHDSKGNSLRLPRKLRSDAAANVVRQQLVGDYKPFDSKIIKAQGFDTFPPSQQPGVLVCARLFKLVQENLTDTLSAVLLSWDSDELPFREISYAILCLASIGSEVSLVPSEQVSHQTDYGYATLPDNENPDIEFLAHLAVGAHLEGLTPGTSPESDMYWFGGALVSRVAQLNKRQDWAIARVVEYCQDKCPRKRVNAVCLSIEHLILMEIDPEGRVRRTELLPLFDIPHHISMDAKERYRPEYLAKLQIRKRQKIKKQRAKQQESRRLNLDSLSTKRRKLYDELSDPDDTEDEDDNCIYKQIHPAGTRDTEATLIALAKFLEASSCQRIGPTKISKRVLPTKIYQKIIHCVKDAQTKRNLKQVSWLFRDFCHQESMLMDGVVFQATEESNNTSGLGLRMKILSTGHVQDVTLRSREYEEDATLSSETQGSGSCCLQIVVGHERNRRSILPDLHVSFDEMEKTES